MRTRIMIDLTNNCGAQMDELWGVWNNHYNYHQLIGLLSRLLPQYLLIICIIYTVYIAKGIYVIGFTNKHSINDILFQY